MTVLDTLRIASRALWRNRLRSFLTALGMIIGVGAVIAMVAIGEGAKAKVKEQFNAMGSNLLILMPGANNTGGVRGGSGSQPTLTWDDLKAVETELSSVKEASPQLRVSAQVMSDDSNWATSIYGVSPEYFSIRTWEVVQGLGFARTDVDGALKLALLGQTVVDKLYPPGFDPVGRTIRIKNMPFQVVGILDQKGQSSYGADLDDAVFIPYTTFRARIQGGLLSYIAGSVYISAASADSTDRAENDIRGLLRARHHLEDGTDDDFFIRNMTELAATTEESMKTLSALLASVAAVSLLIGGIGIMNIMLVSVTERTREIGIRMAVGARPIDILSQFLVEALSLAVIGGAAGVGLGVLSAHRLADRMGWPTLVEPAIIVLAVGFSALIGIIFGMYPAWKASQLDPIDALRYE